MTQTIDPQKLKDSYLGQELDAGEIEDLQSILGVHSLSDGDVLVEEGDEDRRLFLLADGRLEVLSRQHGELEHVYLMSPGEFAGTRAFVDAVPRQATLKARGDATLYALEPAELESRIEKTPHLVYKVMRALFRITHVNLMRMNKEAQELANYVYKRGGRY
ncbi:MAG: Crp/Fnr family transcriptional regulator [Candidatus Wenzhouxiangella sp. M2_3B_020]